MTLQNGLVTATTGYLWSDTAWLEWPLRNGGVVQRFMTKTMHSRTWPFAVSTSLTGLDEAGFLALIEAIGNAYPANLGALLSDCEAALLAAVVAYPQAKGRLLVVGWCQELDEPRLFLIASEEVCGSRPFHAIEMGHMVCTANDSEEYGRFQSDLRPAAMERVIRRQRSMPMHFGEDTSPVFGIGGELIRHTVGRHGVKAELLKRWPDKIGRPIMPARCNA